MKPWPAIWKQLLAASLLCLVALFAVGWTSLYCHYFGSPFANAANAVLTLFQTTDGPAMGSGLDEFHSSFVPSYWASTTLTFAWVIAMSVYVWRVRRSGVGLAIGLLPIAVFASASVINLRMAWPACNAF